MILAILLALATLIVASTSQMIANLSQIGYNFAMSLNIGPNKVPTTFIMDTGNGEFTILKNNISNSYVNITSSNTECTFLEEDSTSIMYYTKTGENAFLSCSSGSTFVSLGSASILTNITVAQYLEIDNPNLHPWNNADGDIGVGYCYDPYYGPCYLTSFQELLMNVSGYNTNYIKMVNQGSLPFPSSLIFGLNLNPKASNLNSTMQLGFVDPIYNNSIVWQKQSTQYPEYHSIFINNLTICGQNILNPMANTWGVLVDTGSVCLSLPEELYNTFISWIDLSPISNANMLPTFSFSIGNENFYIPLSSLLVNQSMITFESGAPEISVNGILKNICVLQGDPVSSSGSTSYSIVNIVFGTLVLENMHFAADFGSKNVGFASKFSAAEISQFSSSSCKAPATCEGSTTFINTTNSCTISCGSFIFTAYDQKTKKCTYSNSAAGFGLFILFIIISMEVSSFFVMQYSAIQLLEGNGNIRRSTTFGITKIDQITYFVGKYLTYVVDTVSEYFNESSRNNGTPRPAAQNILNHRV